MKGFDSKLMIDILMTGIRSFAMNYLKVAVGGIK
jgi:hypothetical protein